MLEVLFPATRTSFAFSGETTAGLAQEVCVCVCVWMWVCVCVCVCFVIVWVCGTRGDHLALLLLLLLLFLVPPATALDVSGTHASCCCYLDRA